MYSYNKFCLFDRKHHIENIVNRKDLSYMKDVYKKTKALKYIRYYGLKGFTFVHPHDPFVIDKTGNSNII